VKNRILLAVVIGAFIGISLYTFRYAEGFSYFSTDPKACMNCHIMKPQYDSWQKASHHSNASCVECHLPLLGTGSEREWDDLRN
jgi:cytochrome c nitrite reductase small subunit